MTNLDKIKQKIKKMNKNNTLYWISTSILILLLLFVLITTIIQTNWVGIPNLQSPILIWMISQPFVGVFFVPFLLLITYICWFICSIGKPTSINKMKADARILFEENKIKKEEYEVLYKILSDAQKRETEIIEREKNDLENKMKELIFSQENRKEAENEKEGN